jgi:tetratricopeptide (TPR) repeat protein
MTDVNRLKNEARSAEQRGDWTSAIKLYQQAIELGETGRASLDVSLHNRVGDLYLRLGEVPSAITAYEAAADRYAEQELLSSAIALCKKILRTAGDHSAAYLRLARLEARTGLFAEARNNFLIYAQRMEEEGHADEALDALKELVDLSDDEPGRIKLAEHLAAGGRQEEALEQLETVARRQRERGADASATLRRISEIGSGRYSDAPASEVALDLESELLEAKQGLGLEEQDEAAAAEETSRVPSPEQEIDALTTRLSASPDDHHSRVRFGQLLAASQRTEEARTEFERALTAFEAGEEYREAMHVVEELLRLDPGDIPLQLRRIQVAARLHDEQALINSYLELGTCIEKRLSSFSLRLLSSSSDSGDVSAVFDIAQASSKKI